MRTRTRPAEEAVRAALADLVPTVITIRVWLVFLYQGKPHPCHLQENGSVLFILGGACHFQAFCGEATVLVRLAHGTSPSCWLTISNAEETPIFPKSVIFGDGSKMHRHLGEVADAERQT